MVNMKSAIIKDALRDIRRTISRYLSIFFITALGVAFFAGVKATCPDMKLTADKYFDDYNLMDIRLVSTIGFNNDDIKEIKKTSYVDKIMPSYSIDAMVNVDNRDLVLKVLSLPDEINKVKLIAGRLPQNPGECVAEKGKIVSSGMSIGSKIELTSGCSKDIHDSLKLNKFTIVGIVETPYYISYERGTSSIGNGKINSFIMIPKESFKLPVYTDIFITVKNAEKELCYDDNYKNIIDPVKKALDKMAGIRTDTRYNEIINDANEKINSSIKDLKNAEIKSNLELKSARDKLIDSRDKIAKSTVELKNNEADFNKKIKESEAKLADGYNQLSINEAKYNSEYNEFQKTNSTAEDEFKKAEDQINSLDNQISAGKAELEMLKNELSSGQLSAAEKTQLEEKISALQSNISTASAQLEALKTGLVNKKKSLYEAKNKLEIAGETLKSKRKHLDNEKITLENTRSSIAAQFKNAEKKIKNSKAELIKGENNYKNAKKEADKKISDAEIKIDNAKKEVKNIEKPVWYVLDRNSNPGFVDYGNAADRMAAIAQVFPVFFFLIAALVCLTTMTRMVDEERTLIGTLKALGYSKSSIAFKYLLYALSASILGSIIGASIGFKIFPYVIFNAYEIMYTLPPVITKFNVFYASISTAFAVIATGFAAWSACSSELAVAPALLMRPKSPASGKRIFLENIKFIWSKFNFTKKITARNIFRYKKRFFMTVLGVGGCTALLLAGFGLKDSIVSIVSKQFNELYKYDMIISLKNSGSLKDNKDITDLLLKDTRIKDSMFIKEESVDAGSGKYEKSVTLLVPESAEKLKGFITLRVRTTRISVPFSDSGVVITEKLSKMLNVGIGDNIYIKNGDTNKVSVKVTGITENYVSHYIYMSPGLYKNLYKESPEFQEILSKTTDTSEDFENRLSTDLLKNSRISSIKFTTGVSKNFNDIIVSLNYVVLVLIISAGALAFVVLYNLTNINVNERIREIATIKVLGFYDGEVVSYIYRENIILTIIGMALGLVLGIFLHRFIVVTAEVEYVMFGREIKPLSYVYSAILTIVFSSLVNLIMYFRLKKVDMVESMKSVD